MARVKTGPYRRQHHKKVLKITKGQFGTRHRLYRRANEAMLKSMWYAYRDRRQRKRDLRRLCVTRRPSPQWLPRRITPDEEHLSSRTHPQRYPTC
jgi:ribosomal protein L20